METIQLNWEDYVKVSEVTNNQSAQQIDWMDYVLVRTYSAWVHCWYLKEKNGKVCTLLKARRLRTREGAASCSQLAMEWVSKPEKCKFPCEVNEIELTEAVEYILMTEKARLSIQWVEVWKE